MKQSNTFEDNILKKYEKWLNEYSLLTEGSAKSYCTYIKNAFKTFSNKNEDISLEAVTKEYEKNTQIQDLLNRILNYIINNKSESNEKKNLRKARSSLFKYWDFLEELNETKSSPTDNKDNKSIMLAINSVLQEYTSKSDSEYYEKNVLSDKFKGRYRTDNRVSEGLAVYCPNKLILPLLNSDGKKKIKQLIDDQIKDFKLIKNEKGEQVSFKEIEGIIMNSKGEVEIILHKGQQKFTLYTRTAEDSFRKFNCLIKNQPSLRTITRDHVKPISEALNQLYEEEKLPCLEKLTNAIKAASEDDKEIILKSKKGITEARERLCQNNNWLRDDGYLKDLVEELGLVEEEIGGYEIMESSENSSKGGINRK